MSIQGSWIVIQSYLNLSSSFNKQNNVHFKTEFVDVSFNDCSLSLILFRHQVDSAPEYMHNGAAISNMIMMMMEITMDAMWYTFAEM